MATYNVTLGAEFYNSVSTNNPSGTGLKYTNVWGVRVFSSQTSYNQNGEGKQYIRFRKLPAEYANSRIVSISLRINTTNRESDAYWVSGGPAGDIGYPTLGLQFGLRAISSDWLQNGISHDASPSISSQSVSRSTTGAITFSNAELKILGIKNILDHGIRVDCQPVLTGWLATPGAQMRYYISVVTNAESMELNVILDDNIPWADNLSPAFGPFDASGSNTFSWNFNAEEGISSTPKQKSCVVQWRGPDGIIHELNGGPDSRLTIPGGIMPLNVPIEWRVKVTGTNDVESAWSDWITLQPLDRTPAVLRPAPQSGYLDDSRSNDFTWELGMVGAKPSVMPKQMTFEYQWRDATGTVRTISGGPASAISVPGGTFPFQQPFSWRVRIQSDDNLWSAWTEWFNLTTVPIRGNAVAISPNGEFLPNGSPITFVWQHASPAGLPQAGWEIQYSPDLSRGWTTIAESDPDEVDRDQRHTVTEYDMQSGVMYWRVRTKDEAGNWGDWSAHLENYLRDKPARPEVNQPANEARPLVTWQAEEQFVYQLQIRDMDGNVLYDSQAVASEGRQHQVTDFLASGTYIFAVRVQNQFGDWSDWDERVATITLTDIGTPEISCAALYGAIRVLLRAPVAGAYHIIYRKEERGAYLPIAVLDEGATLYDDYTCNGLCRYYARAVKDGSFADSRAATDAPDMRHTLVALASRPSDMVAVWYRKGQRPDRRETTRAEVNLRHFQGRALPVAEYGEGIDRERSFTFSIAWNKDPDGVRRLMEMVEAAQPFIVRDQYGRKFFAALPSFQTAVDRHSGDFTLTFNEVDYQEGIADA